jgi:predicted dehydrogenase
MEKIRIGFIGAGGIARAHVRRLKAVPEAQVVAMAEPSPASRAAMVETHPETADCAWYSDYHEMLEVAELDAVEIHTPHTLHFQQAVDVLALDLPLLLEKPMVTTTADAEALIAAAKNKILGISYQRHYQPMYIYVKQIIESGALGTLQYLAALQSQNWYHSQRGKWRQDPALSGGGQLNDSGSHLIDIMLWTTGLVPESVYASMENYESQVDIDSAIAIRFAGGAQGTISIIGDSPFWREDFSIWGSKGGLLYRNGQLLQQIGAGPLVEVTDLPQGSDPDVNFVNAILGREAIGAPPECGLEVIRFSEAAWRSAAEGRVVRID